MKVAIIGAGSSGLSAVKQCIDAHYEVVCFESTSQFGGLWRYGPGSVYKSVTMNTSRDISGFSDFPIPSSFPLFLSHDYVIDYLSRYASHFGLEKYIKFNCPVRRCVPYNGDRWEITTDTERLIFDAVMVCTGHHSIPRIPHFDGMEKFQGRVIHSRDYRLPHEYENKRVAIIGVGNSAASADIACEISQKAQSVSIISRSGVWVLPRTLNGKPMDVLLSRFVCSLPRSLLQNVFQKTSAILLGSTPEYLKPKGGLFEGHPTIKSDLFDKISAGKINVKPAITRFFKNSILFSDGKKEEFDTVIFCTGYNIGFPFFDRSVISHQDNKVSLYKMIVPPTHRNIFFIGLVQPLGAIMPVAEIQTRWALSVLQRPELLPTPPSMHLWIARDQERRKKRYMASSRHTIEVDWLPYMDLLAKDIGCRPTFWRVLRQNRSLKLALKTCFGTPKTEYFRILKGSYSCSKLVLDRLSTDCDIDKG